MPEKNEHDATIDRWFLDFDRKGDFWVVFILGLAMFLPFVDPPLVLVSLALLVAGILLIRHLEKEEGPGARPGSPEYAGFWPRLMAGVLDLGVYFLFYILCRVVMGSHFYGFLPFGLMGVLYLSLCLWMMVRWGQTPGKMMVGIKVVRLDFSEVGWGTALLRDSLTVLVSGWDLLKSFLIVLGFISAGLLPLGFKEGDSFWVLFLRLFDEKLNLFVLIWLFSECLVLLTNPRRRALHDFLAGTLVVRKDAGHFSRIGQLAALVLTVPLAVGFWRFDKEMNRYRAERGVPYAQCALGLEALQEKNGEGQVPDGPLAIEWLTKAADQGHRSSMYYLGEIHEKGSGVERDLKKAGEWYKKAADLGHWPSQMALKGLGRKGRVKRSEAEWVPSQRTPEAHFQGIREERAGSRDR